MNPRHAAALTLLVWAVLVVGGLILESDSVRPRSGAEPSEARDTHEPANFFPYTVMPGDTISGIAAMFSITPDALARANQLQIDDKLNVGKVLKVPHPHPVIDKFLKIRSFESTGWYLVYPSNLTCGPLVWCTGPLYEGLSYGSEDTRQNMMEWRKIKRFDNERDCERELATHGLSAKCMASDDPRLNELNRRFWIWSRLAR